MEHIAFVMPWLLPMPAVRGGAVETLVQSLIDRNEQEKRLHITVFTIEDEQARACYRKYRMTEFVPISVSPWKEKAAWFLRGVLNKTVHYHLSPGYAYLQAVRKAMRGRKFDLVVAENHAPLVPVLARCHVGPVDLHLHNVVILHEQQHPERLSQQCRKILTVSNYISGWVQKTLQVPAEQCRLLLNCVDWKAFHDGRSQRMQIREKLGIRQGEILFLYAGRLCPEKGALELARAFCQLQLENTRLAIVGSRWFGKTQIDSYEQQVRQALEPVADRVIFTGFIDYKQIPAYYGAADVMVAPSVWEEPGQLVALEAQAAGIPLISTDTGGTSQNVCPQGAVLLRTGEDLPARLAEAMRELALDENRRRAMSRAAQEWSRTRDLDAYYRDFLDAIDGPPVRETAKKSPYPKR